MDKYEVRDIVTSAVDNSLEYLWGDALIGIIDHYYSLGYTIEQIIHECYLEDYSIICDCCGDSEGEVDYDSVN